MNSSVRLVAFLVLVSVLGGCPGDGPGVGEEPVGETTPVQAAVLFREVSGEHGLMFEHSAGLRGALETPEIIGPGVAVFDYDGDGDLDLYLVNGRGRSDDEIVRNRLYRQEGDGTFADVTEDAGVGDRGFGMGATVGDLDRDGDLDLVVTNYGGLVAYFNEGDGTFVDDTRRSGLVADGWPVSATVFVLDDGDDAPDLYVARYLDYDPEIECNNIGGSREYCGPDGFPGLSDRVFRNRGDGSFEDVTEVAGIGGTQGKGLGVLAADFDGDGRQDVFVANDGELNNLWINQGGGRLLDQATVLGVAVNLMGESEASMGVAAGDVDRDGDIDLFVTHLNRETNTLYQNVGGAFVDRVDAGLGPDSLAATGFGAAFFDLELDGDLDVMVVNGLVSLNEGGQSPALRTAAGGVLAIDAYGQANQLFLNDGTGRFIDATELSGLGSVPDRVSRGLVLADWDRDGDLDPIVSNCDAPVEVWANESLRIGHWLALSGPAGRPGELDIGARVALLSGGELVVRWFGHGYSYLSAGPGTPHLGFRDEESAQRLRLEWTDGRVTEIVDPPIDRFLSVAPPSP